MAFLKRIWNFIWHDDSLASWLVNLILAFVLVKWVIYPGLGLLFGTSFPIVAVVSGSMDHEGMDFDSWWQQQGGWYVERDIDKETFHFFPFRNGFKMGDIMILRGIEPKDIKIGDVLVYESSTHRNPIIHRVVEMNLEEGAWTFRTKGDHNTGADYEVIHENQIERTGKAILRLPYLGWVKIWFVRLVGLE